MLKSSHKNILKIKVFERNKDLKDLQRLNNLLFSILKVQRGTSKSESDQVEQPISEIYHFCAQPKFIKKLDSND